MIVITGGKGFIGGHLYDYAIQHEQEVIVIDNLSHPSQRSTHIPFIRLDLANDNIYYLKDVDVIYHLAADISVINSMKNPLYTYRNNMMSLLNMLELARKKDAKFVFSSSAAVYGNTPEGIKVDETFPLRPTSVYGLSKLHGEHLIEMYHQNYGIDYCILRYSNVYGPGADLEGGVISKFTSKMLRNEQVEIYGDPVRDFIYVDDVAKITYLARYHTGKYNLSSGVPTRIIDLFNSLSRLTNYTKTPILQPQRQGEIKYSVLDNKKLMTEFKDSLERYSVSLTPLELGLRRTVEYIKSLFR
ncbi:MAG: NAD-dependent epimerase/dehydratase family protein [Candidatus Micrarchaeota archaeon]|nr:NAD-dependent epimerase/dehydratase family protein [Candidatus Micrarchaeota archaeon]